MISINKGLFEQGDFSLLIPDFILKDKCIHVTGSNGSGKSTFLRLIAGISSLTDGKRELKEPTKIGYVPQNYRTSLMPWMSAIQNVLLLDKSVERVSDLISIGFKESELKKRPHDLSGGQCQRVAIARELTPINSVVLMDEPFSGLDIDTVPKVGLLLRRFIQRGGVVVLTSHTDLPSSLLNSTPVTELRVVRESDNTAKVLTQD